MIFIILVVLVMLSLIVLVVVVVALVVVVCMGVGGGLVGTPFFKNLLLTFILPVFYKFAYPPVFADFSKICHFLL